MGSLSVREVHLRGEFLGLKREESVCVSSRRVGIGAIDYMINVPAKITQCEWKSDLINAEESHATPIPL